MATVTSGKPKSATNSGNAGKDRAAVFQPASVQAGIGQEASSDASGQAESGGSDWERFAAAVEPFRPRFRNWLGRQYSDTTPLDSDEREQVIDRAFRMAHERFDHWQPNTLFVDWLDALVAEVYAVARGSK